MKATFARPSPLKLLFILLLLFLGARWAVAATPTQTAPNDGAVNLPVEVTLDWNTLAGADGYDYEVLDGNTLVAGYGITYSGGPWRRTSVTLSLEYGKTYRWRVRGRVLPQNNPWSGYWRFATSNVPTPSQVAPANAATGVNPSVSLDWSSVTGADGYDFEVLEGATVVAGYGINYSGGPYRGTSVRLNLEFGKTYRWRVRGRILPQNNPWSDYWTFTTAGVPLAVQASPDNGAVGLTPPVTLRWHTLAGADGYDFEVLDGNTVVAGYGINYSDGPYRDTSVTLPLTYGKTYRWRVRGRILPQNNLWSDYWSFSTGLTPVPTSVAASAVSSTSARVTWLNPNGSVEAIQIFQRKNSGSDEFGENVPPDRQSAVRGGLEAGATYSFKVRIQMGGRWSDFSPAASVTLPPVAVAIPPPNVTASVVSPNSAQITWRNPSGSIQAVQIHQSHNGGSFALGMDVPPNQQSAVRDRLEPGTQYCFNVRVQIGGQWSPFSEATCVTLPELPPELPVSPPTNLAASVRGPESIELRWTNPSGAIEATELYSSSDGAAFKAADNVTIGAQSVLLDGLEPEIEYSFKVRVRVGGRWSGFSELTSITIPLIDPNEPLPARLGKTTKRGMMVGALNEQDISALAQLGANLARWQFVIPDPNVAAAMTLDEYKAWLQGQVAYLDTLLPVFLQNGISVIVDLHTPPHGLSDQTSGRQVHALFRSQPDEDYFKEIWTTLAQHYKGNPTIWAFDILNEPCTGGQIYVEKWQKLSASVAQSIAGIDSARQIIIECPYGSPDKFNQLAKIPLPNVIYSFHMYAPGDFTHQGLFGRPLGVRYPGTISRRVWNARTIAAWLQRVVDFQKKYRVKIFVGEFSAVCYAPGDSARRYLGDAIRFFEKQGWDWTYHAFREYSGWSVEHVGTNPNDIHASPSPTDRQQLLESWFRKNQK
jgi:hypothetical protein